MKLSLVIPTRNRNDFLALLLDSVVGTVDEVVVRDNANGAARAIADRYPTVRWIFGAELSMFENWRACLDAASSEYVAIPSDDDLYLPSFAPALRALGPEELRAEVIIAGHRTIDAEGRTLGEWRPPRREVLPAPRGFLGFQYGVPARMPAVFFRTDFLRRIGSLDSSYQLTAADSELVQRALLAGTVAFVPEVIAAYRVWPGGLTDQKQMSTLWMSEIEKWSAKVAPLAAEALGDARLPFDAARYADELFATNLLAGLSRAAANGNAAQALRFFREMRVPWCARPRTKLSLLRTLSTLAAKAARQRLLPSRNAPSP